VPKVEVPPMILAESTSVLGAGSPVVRMVNPYQNVSEQVTVERFARAAPEHNVVPVTRIPVETLVPPSSVDNSSVQNPLLPLLAASLSEITQDGAAEEEVERGETTVQSVAPESVVDDQLAAQTGQLQISPVASDDESEALASGDESEPPERGNLDQASSAQKLKSSGDPTTSQSGV